MKQCARCKVSLPEELFSWKSKLKGILSPYCRACNRLYQKQHYLDHKDVYRIKRRANSVKVRNQNRNHILQYLESHPCIDCGETDPIVLEFDHRMDSTKRNNIGNMLSGAAAWTSIWTEIQKCEVRCSNCHKRKTARDFKWYKALSSIG